MCLAVAAQVVRVEDEFNAEAEVDGVVMKISTALVPDIKKGDYVLVHAGFAIEIIDRVAATENIKIWRQLHDNRADMCL